MAHWIDRAALWLFAASSALLLFLILTGGRLFFSLAATFALILLLRLSIQKLPDKQIGTRKKQKRRAERQIRVWALIDKNDALAQLHSLIPELFDSSLWPSVRLIQRMPQDPLSANELLELHRSALACNQAPVFLCTCPISPEAAALCDELLNPPVHLVGSNQIMRLLSTRIHLLPAEEIKKERRRPFTVRIAQSASSIRPARSAVYALLFLSLYTVTDSRFYLFSALLFILQLSFYIVVRMMCSRRAV